MMNDNRLFSFLYPLNFKRIAGLRFRTLINLSLMVMIGILFLLGGAVVWVIPVLAVLGFIFEGVMRYAVRNKFSQFLPGNQLRLNPPNQMTKAERRALSKEVPVRISGRLSSDTAERDLFFANGIIWLLATGEIGVRAMLESENNFYQFIPLNQLKSACLGEYWIASERFSNTLSIDFHSNWGKSEPESGIAYYVEPEAEEFRFSPRQLVLIFDDEGGRSTVTSWIAKDL